MFFGCLQYYFGLVKLLHLDIYSSLIRINRDRNTRSNVDAQCVLQFPGCTTIQILTIQIPTTQIWIIQIPTTQIQTIRIPTTQIPTTQIPTTQIWTIQISTIQIRKI